MREEADRNDRLRQISASMLLALSEVWVCYSKLLAHTDNWIRFIIQMIQVGLNIYVGQNGWPSVHF
jgi:hypothetical protein